MFEYEVQQFTMITEGHLTKELNKRAEQGWRVVSTAINDKPRAFVVTWERSKS